MMYAYNPRKKSSKQLEKSLVGNDRWAALKNILQELAIEDGEGPKQHWIIIGPRGIGKSHLLALLYYQVKKSMDLRKLWVPVLFPEDLRMAGNLSKFLQRATNEILLELEQEQNPISDELKKKIRKVIELPPAERSETLFSIISWLHQKTGKFILLIIENLQQLLGKKISPIEQKKLRAFLQTSDSLLIIGSATTIFNALHDHSHPFYHFFHIRRLEDLNFSDMKTLIVNLLSESEQPELIKEIKDKNARLKTLYSFTGGNPRMAVFLTDIIKTEAPDEMLELMDGILDQLTPYFESILNDTPDYLEEIINTLAAFEPAQSPREIAGHLEVPQATIRNYLKQLKETGYVRIAFSKGKSNYYCLNEYLYRIWYQMRDSGHREETRWLMELLLMLYSPDDIIEEKSRIDPHAEMEEIAYGDSLMGMKRYNEALKQYEQIMNNQPEYYQVNLSYGQLLEKKRKKEQAIYAYLKYISVGSDTLTNNFDFQKPYNEHILPLVKTLKPGKYIKQFYTPEQNGKFSRPQLSILLILSDKYDIVGEHIQEIVKTFRKRKDKNDFDLFIFTIKLNFWLKLCEGNIHDGTRLINLYIEYIKALQTTKQKEDEVSQLSLGLLRIQINLNIDAKNILKLLNRLDSADGVPFNNVLLKVWTCISEPDSIEAQKYLNEKAIAEVVKELKGEKVNKT